METLKKIGVETNKNFILTIGSKAMAGKTTMVIKIATELVNEGKKVLFISEDREIDIKRRVFKKIDFFDEVNQLRVFGDVYNEKILFEKFKNQIGTRKIYDYVIFDIPFSYKDNQFINLLEYFKEINTNVLLTVKLNLDLGLIVDRTSNKITQISDYVLILSKKEKISFFEKCKYWVKCLKIPNLSIRIIKNRYGKNKQIDLNIEFKN